MHNSTLFTEIKAFKEHIGSGLSSEINTLFEQIDIAFDRSSSERIQDIQSSTDFEIENDLSDYSNYYKSLGKEIANLEKRIKKSKKSITKDIDKLMKFLTKLNSDPVTTQMLKDLEAKIVHNEKQLEFINELAKLEEIWMTTVKDLKASEQRGLINAAIKEAARHAKYKYNDSIKSKINSLEHMLKAFAPGSTSNLATATMIESLRASFLA